MDLAFARLFEFGCLLFLSAFVASKSCALADDYLDETLVYSTAERHELAGEGTIDYGRFGALGSGESPRYFERAKISTEYGITDRWMIELRTGVVFEHGSPIRFDSASLESRYRFAQPGRLPVDFALSGEVNIAWDREFHRYVSGIEPRLILSRDFGALNVTGNLSKEFPLTGAAGTVNVALGAAFQLVQERIHLGAECKYDGHDRIFRVVPQIFVRLAKGVQMKTGLSIATRRQGDVFFRSTLSFDF